MMKEIEEFPGYFATEGGEIYSCKRSKPVQLKTQKNIDGYNVVNLFKNGKYHHRRVARLVAETFIPNPDNLPVVNHIDHTRDNDCVDNLEWCTIRDNAIFSQTLHPERWRARAEITVEDAHEICKMIEEDHRNKEISEKLGISIDTIKHIRSGASWGCVSKHYTLKRARRSVSEETVRWICRMIVENHPNREIVRMAKSKSVSKHIVKQIRGKRTWTEVSKEYF